MFDPNKPAQTRRSGRKARIVATDVAGPFPLLALVMDEQGNEIPTRYHANGRFVEEVETDADLINVPEETSFYVALYPEEKNKPSGRFTSGPAIKAKPYSFLLTGNYRPVVRVVFRDGEFAGAELVRGRLDA